MKIREVHNFDVHNESEFIKIQSELRKKIALRNSFEKDSIRLVAGVDLAYQENDNRQYGTCCISGYWKYEDEQEFIETLNEIKELLLKQGIKALGKLSVPDKIEATNEMYHELYLKHSELAACFQQEHNIQLEAFDDENIDRWFEVIEEQVEELKRRVRRSKRRISKDSCFSGGCIDTF